VSKEVPSVVAQRRRETGASQSGDKGASMIYVDLDSMVCDVEALFVEII
jgi:hypothetical protein